MITLITLANIFLLSWTITKFQPLHSFFDYVSNKLNKAGKVSKIASVCALMISSVYLMITCLLCCSFWTALLLTHNLYYACLSGFVGYWYEKLTERLDKITRFN